MPLTYFCVTVPSGLPLIHPTFATQIKKQISTSTKTVLIMETNFVISPRVVNTINSLPAGEREVITTALAYELILGRDASELLSPFQGVVYAIIRSYVKQDTIRMRS